MDNILILVSLAIPVIVVGIVLVVLGIKGKFNGKGNTKTLMEKSVHNQLQPLKGMNNLQIAIMKDMDPIRIGLIDASGKLYTILSDLAPWQKLLSDQFQVFEATTPLTDNDLWLISNDPSSSSITFKNNSETRALQLSYTINGQTFQKVLEKSITLTLKNASNIFVQVMVDYLPPDI